MGYANIAQRGQGLHLRQYVRTYIIEDAGKYVAFVNVDGAMMTSAIRRDVKFNYTYMNTLYRFIINNIILYL